MREQFISVAFQGHTLINENDFQEFFLSKGYNIHAAYCIMNAAFYAGPDISRDMFTEPQWGKRALSRDENKLILEFFDLIGTKAIRLCRSIEIARNQGALKYKNGKSVVLRDDREIGRDREGSNESLTCPNCRGKGFIENNFDTKETRVDRYDNKIDRIKI